MSNKNYNVFVESPFFKKNLSILLKKEVSKNEDVIQRKFKKD